MAAACRERSRISSLAQDLSAWSGAVDQHQLGVLERGEAQQLLVADCGAVPRHGAALVAEAVLVADRALAHIGDDFHVVMRMRRKPRSGGDLVVVPHAQRAPSHALGVAVVREREMMTCVKPVELLAAQAGK